MAIFCRRDVQRALDTLGVIATAGKARDIVARLNGDPVESLAAEWEVVLLSGFARIGRVSIEKSFGGSARPDLHFQRGSCGTLEFIADITTVSDRSAHAQNPWGEFWNSLRTFTAKRGQTMRGLDLRVKEVRSKTSKRNEVRLLLPIRAEINAFIRTRLTTFFDRIRHEPDQDDQITIDEEGIAFTLAYQAAQTGASGGYAVYTIPSSEKQNPLSNQLKKKVAQLSASGSKGLHGIIVCDGDCEGLRPRGTGAKVGCHEIIARFFADHSSVAFVCLVRVAHGGSLRREAVIESELFWHPARSSHRELEIRECFHEVINALPPAEETPPNALRRLAKGEPRVGFSRKGYSVSATNIKLPARAVLEVLAGTLNQPDFLSEHSPRGYPAPIYQMLASGRLLKRIYLERSEHEDDDWIIFEFGDPDVAISPYRLPPTPT